MVAPLVRTSVCAKPGKSFAATSFDGFGGSSGKDTGFIATVCVAWALSGMADVPIKAASAESLSISRRFIVVAEFRSRMKHLPGQSLSKFASSNSNQRTAHFLIATLNPFPLEYRSIRLTDSNRPKFRQVLNGEVRLPPSNHSRPWHSTEEKPNSGLIERHVFFSQGLSRSVEFFDRDLPSSLIVIKNVPGIAVRGHHQFVAQPPEGLFEQIIDFIVSSRNSIESFLVEPRFPSRPVGHRFDLVIAQVTSPDDSRESTMNQNRGPIDPAKRGFHRLSVFIADHNILGISARVHHRAAIHIKVVVLDLVSSIVVFNGNPGIAVRGQDGFPVDSIVSFLNSIGVCVVLHFHGGISARAKDGLVVHSKIGKLVFIPLLVVAPGFSRGSVLTRYFMPTGIKE